MAVGSNPAWLIMKHYRRLRKREATSSLGELGAQHLASARLHIEHAMHKVLVLVQNKTSNRDTYCHYSKLKPFPHHFW